MTLSNHRNVIIAVVVVFTLGLLLHNHVEYLESNVSVLLDKAQYKLQSDQSYRVGGGKKSGKGDAKSSKPKKTGKTMSFLEIGAKHGTDKVTHRYHHMYSKYLDPVRDQPLKFLEIGLGCDMSYGPGASYNLWLEYIPNIDLYFIEYDADCASKWADKTGDAHIFIGDQANTTFLAEFIKETGGQFDVIIDDGGHTMVQQKTSFEVLFPEVKHNGMYFIEDLGTSWYGNYGAGNWDDTTVKDIADGINLIHTDQRAGRYEEVVSIDCFMQVCAFTKASEDGEPKYPYSWGKTEV